MSVTLSLTDFNIIYKGYIKYDELLVKWNKLVGDFNTSESCYNNAIKKSLG